jgi:alkanesulfonate monooxygenase SsuD/methylene tetrahydromethanopterin reductase-like flavin-dependent oxidoreductase (luciferase family)
MTHWFPLGLEVLQRKTAILAGYCEAIGRDPASIERTMAAPVLVAGTEAEAAAMLQYVPPERRPHVWAGTAEQAANELKPYLDAGFTGFTFNNTIYRTTDQIAVLGDLLRMVEGATASA